VFYRILRSNEPGRARIARHLQLTFFENTMRQVKIIVEKHADGYVAYPVGMKGAIIGQGDAYEEALSDVKSAIAFHLETFGKDAFDADEPVLDVFIAETAVAA
jgi:predicted RNase H-like HicB family nuclease